MYVAPLDVTTYHDVRVFVSTMTQHSSTAALISSNFELRSDAAFARSNVAVDISTLLFTMTLRVCFTIVCLLLASSFALVSGSSNFSSNVVLLNSRNWRREVEDSPHAVFVNVCRSG